MSARSDNFYLCRPSLYGIVQDSCRLPFNNKGDSASFPYTERHLKCAWFDSALRPRVLRAHDGAIVVVEHPGRWNQDAGPDFVGASLLLMTSSRGRAGNQAGQRPPSESGLHARRFAGDVEIHVSPSDWQRHGHNRDPAYRGVVAHVTYFPECLPAGVLPKGALQISLKEGLANDPLFSFESIDITAYPFSQPRPPTPCSAILRNKHPDLLECLLEAAGQERLRQKSERMAIAIDERGASQVLYEEIMSALGYRKNRRQFRLLADRLPLLELRKESGFNEIAGYALLMGVAGLLPTKIRPSWDYETRSFVRQLWNYWWKHQFPLQDRAMEKSDWITTGVRPQNHPQRRLMAAATLFCREPRLEARLRELDTVESGKWIDGVLSPIRETAPSYWDHRLCFGGKRSAKRMLLTGERRAAAIVLNVIMPFMAASRPDTVKSALLKHAPREEDNSVIRQTAFALFGPDHSPSLYRTGLRQQGLLQIFHDHCVNDRSGCRTCRFPSTLERFFRAVGTHIS